MNHKKSQITAGYSYQARVLLIAVLLGTILFLLPGTAHAQIKPFDYKGDTLRVAGEITLTLRAGKFDLKRVGTDEEIIWMKDFRSTSSPGDPTLPCLIYDVAVPPNIDWETVELELATNTVILPGHHKIKPMPPLRARVGDEELIDWGEGKDIVNGRNMNIYGQKAFFPLEPVTIASQSQMRKWKFLRLEFTPVQYNPVDGQLRLTKSVLVRVKFRRIGTKKFRANPILRDTVMDNKARKRFFNFNEAQKWYRYIPGSQLFKGGEDPDYVIITTNAIVAGSGSGLTDFVNHKINLGHTVQVVTETDYGPLTGQAPDGTAEKIRQWLINNYIPLGIKWVLLIGNPDPDDPAEPADAVGDVPMKMCWPRRGATWYPNYDDSPTDHFYANLTGNWDLDGDAFYGEGISITNSTTPDPAIDPETFSVRWIGQIEADDAGIYYFRTSSDEGIRVVIDGTTVIDNWTGHFPTINYGSITLTAGLHDIEIEFYDISDDAVAKFYWCTPGSSYYPIVPSTKLYHLSGGSYVSGGLDGEYFNNEDFTASVLVRVDPTINFYWGTGDDGPGGVDFTPDLYVGRIPVYGGDYITLNNILQKIIDYESEISIPAWRRKLLFAAAYLWEPSSDYQLGEALKEDFANPLGFSTYRAYESDFGLAPPPECPAINTPDPDPAAPCNMLQEMVNGGGYGCVGWSTHGGQTGASHLINSTHCSSLDDTRPFFTFQGSCLNGYPDNSSNLGYSLLKQGAIATVSASRVSWNACFSPPPNPLNGTNSNLNYHYFMRLMNGIPGGRALFTTKENVNPSWSWMNKMDYNIYGDPTTSLFKPYVIADIDVVQVLDHSGSMSGYTSTSLTDRKIDVLKNAANQFVDMMDAGAGHQLGLVKFSTNATTIMGLQTFTAASAATAHSQINVINATSMTSIGDGLSHAVTEFTTSGIAGHRRVILLVTDGKENTAPMIDIIQPSIITNSVTVYPLGLGYSWGIDETRLINLANATGGDYRITDDDLIFRKYFIEILGSATDWTVVVDPILILAGGETDSIPVTIGLNDTSAIFTAYWSGLDNAVKLSLTSPSGQKFTASSPTYVGKKRYAFYRINLKAFPSSQRTGKWWMVIKADPTVVGLTETVRLSVSALVRSGTYLDTGFDNPFVFTGDGVLIRARLASFGKPITGAKVVAYYSKPVKGFGNVIYDNPVDLRQIQPQIMNGDTLGPLYRKVTYLQKKLGEKFMPRETDTIALYDDGKHEDDAANDGIYANRFTQTKIPGNYTFHFVASDIPADGDLKTTREWTKSFYNQVDIDPKHSDINITLLAKTADGNRYSVKIVPKDRFNNYLGPGHPVLAFISHPNGVRQILLTDNIDGTYTKEILITQSEINAGAKLEIDIDGKRFTEVEPPPSYRKFSLSIHGGIAVPIDNFADDFEQGYNVLVDLDYHFTQQLSFVGFFGYNDFKSKTAGIDDNYWMNVSANIKYREPLRPRLFFYFNGGPGYYIPETGDSRFGLNLGAGFNYDYTNTINFELGADYHTIFDQGIQFVHGHAGLILRF